MAKEQLEAIFTLNTDMKDFERVMNVSSDTDKQHNSFSKSEAMRRLFMVLQNGTILLVPNT